MSAMCATFWSIGRECEPDHDGHLRHRGYLFRDVFLPVHSTHQANEEDSELLDATFRETPPKATTVYVVTTATSAVSDVEKDR